MARWIFLRRLHLHPQAPPGKRQVQHGRRPGAERPYAYQDLDGLRTEVPTRFTRARGQHTFGFVVGDYDRRQPLVLDPSFLVYAGYIGGTGEERALAIAVDSAGNAYVAGSTVSTVPSFPGTIGPDLTHNGGLDAFVAKVKADGTGLVYAGYIGGAGNDVATAIAVNSAGNAYVAGFHAAPLPATDLDR